MAVPSRCSLPKLDRLDDAEGKATADREGIGAGDAESAAAEAKAEVRVLLAVVDKRGG